MKKPKKLNRYCPYCRKKTEQKVKQQSTGKASTLKRGSKQRARLRGLFRGIGNLGRFSRMKNQAKVNVKQLKKQLSSTPAQSATKAKTKRKANELAN